jgi:hypothetical protein
MFLFILIIPLGCASVNTVSCSNSSDKLNCLKANFHSLYHNNYTEFWSILHKSADEVKQCASSTKTAQFLGLVAIQSNNAEFNEFFSDIVEELCVSSPTCFCTGVSHLSDENQQMLRIMLDTPLFFDKKSLEKARCLTNK